MAVGAAVCNLVPVSGSTFAGKFRRGGAFTVAHLDPSYTLVAITVAIAYVRAHGSTISPLTLCCYDADVAQRASDVRDTLHAVLAAA